MFAYKSYLLVFGITLLLNFHETEATENECERTSDADCSITTNGHGGLAQEEPYQDNNKCNDDSMCWNGGTCSNNICKCLPGTHGSFCEYIEGCTNEEEQKQTCGDPDNVYCVYNVSSQKNYCRCADIDFVYDEYNKACKKCECVIFGTCSFVDGEKRCKCTDGYGLQYKNGKQDGCQLCGCGPFNDGCTWYGWSEVCDCKPGFAQRLSFCSECDCGEHGNCSFDALSYKQCSCEPGYIVKNGKCELCDCGSNGDGYWNEANGEKMCDCSPGYGIENGKCVECGCKRDGTVVYNIGCTFSNGEKECLCLAGFEDKNSSCVDINECLNETACPLHSDCKNYDGGYECICKSGFRPITEPMSSTVRPGGEDQPEPDRVVDCEDINECVESDVCTRNETTTCINLPGSYDCVCKEGFIIPPNEKTAENGCHKDEGSKSNVLYIVFGVLFGVIIVGGVAFFLIRKYRR